MSVEINGLRLVSPEEAGVQAKDKHGNLVGAVVLRDGKEIHYYSCGYFWDAIRLIPLPKPKTLRPYRESEVQLGWTFKRKKDGSRFMATSVYTDGIALGGGWHPFNQVLDNFHRLTYLPDGGERLEPAGVEE